MSFPPIPIHRTQLLLCLVNNHPLNRHVALVIHVLLNNAPKLILLLLTRIDNIGSVILMKPRVEKELNNVVYNGLHRWGYYMFLDCSTACNGRA